MKELIEKYLGDKVPVRERLFYMATFLSSVFCLLFVSVATLIRVDKISVAIYASIGILGTVFFFLENRIHRVKMLSVFYLIYVNFLAFPAMLFFSDKDLMEVPLYSLIGLVFTIVLLEGKTRLIMYILETVISIASVFYCFVIKNSSLVHYGPNESNDYFRIEIAVIVTGLLCGFMVTYRNYQLKKELGERELATSKAEQVSYAKDMFLVNVSHEIRTPLNAIIGTTDLLLDSEANNHIKETAFNISNSSHALLSITTDLLDFSRMNIDSILPVDSKYDIAFILNDIINLMSVRLLDSNVSFYVNIDPHLPKILIGDSGKIRQILINMLSNAIKYTKEGHMTLDVSFVPLEGPDKNFIEITFKVSDTGIGIRKESIEKIFEPYNRSGEETDRLIEGNGLGLALCKRLANAMSGTIFAESTYGEGSEFTFKVCQKIDVESKEGNVGFIEDQKTKITYFTDGIKEMEDLYFVFKGIEVTALSVVSEEEFLECCVMDKCNYYLCDSSSYERIKDKLIELEINWSKLVIVSDCNYSYAGEPFEYVLTKPISCLNVSDLINHTQSYAIRKQKFEGTFSMPGANVLVVDDNIVNLDVAEGILERYECNVITASGGKECLITLQEEHVDIIFLDYMMPEMDGIDTLKAIKKLDKGKYKNIPVITLTANVVSGAREMFIKEGFDEYLSKPLEIDKLEKVLRTFIPPKLIKVKS